MRLVLSGFVAAGMLIGQAAGAACISQNNREALDVEALKTQLMVQTLTCKNDDQYNAFMSKFRSDLLNDEKVARTYFRNQRLQDEYMTNLANTKATASQSEGSAFCTHNAELFNEVLALHNGSELKEYAAGRATALPASFDTCDGTTRTASATTTHRRVVRRH